MKKKIKFDISSTVAEPNIIIITKKKRREWFGIEVLFMFLFVLLSFNICCYLVNCEKFI